MPSKDDYECTLDAASLKVAKTELHEDPNNRLGAVETLRKWLEEQPHIKFSKDTKILLMFLRYGKFSQLKAREAIEKYCSAKTTSPKWYDSFNPNAELTIKFIKTGFVVPLPGYDEKGCKRAIYRAAAYNPSDWKDKKEALLNAMYTLFVFLTRDERAQVNGFVYLSDMSGLTMAHQTFWTIDEMKKMMRNWQSAFPARYKAFHQYNTGPIWEGMMALVKPFLTKKFQDRFIMAGDNLEKLYKIFPPSILPDEYLPDDYKGPSAGSISQLMDKLLEDMRTKEGLEFLHCFSNPEWGIDENLKLKDEPVASFRKLNVD